MRLVRPDLALLDAAVEGDDVLAAAPRRRRSPPSWVSFGDALPHTRDRVAQDPGDPRWGTCFFVDQPRPAELVGWGGFKGPPGADGTVEIGYEIAPARQGRGLATAAARAMVAEAFADPAVRRVIAHTLPEPNASNHILEKLGFRFDGDVLERGTPVWRWALPALAAPPAPDRAGRTAPRGGRPSGTRARGPRVRRVRRPGRSSGTSATVPRVASSRSQSVRLR